LGSLLKKQAFNKVQHSPNKLNYQNLFEIKFSESNSPYVGFIINKKYGSSVFRNQLKRRVREHYKKMNKHSQIAIIFRALSSKIDPSSLGGGFCQLTTVLMEKN